MKPGRNGVAGGYGGDASQTQLLDQAVLQGPVRSLDVALGLAGVGAQDLDVELGQRPPKLGHALTRHRTGLGHPEHRVLAGIECHRTAMGGQIALQRLEVALGALAQHEPQLHQPADGIVDEHQQRAGFAPVLEPAVLAAVDLDQLAQRVPPGAGLVEGPALTP